QFDRTPRRRRQQRRREGCQLIVRISLVITEKLVVTDYGSGCRLPVNPEAVGVQRGVPVLKEQSVGAFVDAAVRGPRHIVVRISHAKTQTGLRQKREVNVTHTPGSIE